MGTEQPTSQGGVRGSDGPRCRAAEVTGAFQRHLGCKTQGFWNHYLELPMYEQRWQSVHISSLKTLPQRTISRAPLGSDHWCPRREARDWPFGHYVKRPPPHPTTRLLWNLACASFQREGAEGSREGSPSPPPPASVWVQPGKGAPLPLGSTLQGRGHPACGSMTRWGAAPSLNGPFFGASYISWGKK